MTLCDASPRRFRILSFDGGPYGMASVKLLQALCAREPLLLAHTDLFAGTSFGAFIALFLASRTEAELHDPENTLADLEVLTHAFLQTTRLTLDPRHPRSTLRSFRRMVRFAAGQGPLVRTRSLLDDVVLRHHSPTRGDIRVFGTTRMRDLSRYCVIVAFDLRGGPWAPKGWRGSGAHLANLSDPVPDSWGVRALHNLAPDVETSEASRRWNRGNFDRHYFGAWPDRDLPIAEVFLRSSGFPVMMPQHAGFVDGAVFGNNPTMVAVSSAYHFRRWPNESDRLATHPLGQPRIDSLDDILALSLGGEDSSFTEEALNDRLCHARNQAESFRDAPTRAEADAQLTSEWYEAADEAWGWPRWVQLWSRGDSRNILLGAELLVTADGRGVAYQANHLLGPGHHLRLTLDLPGAGEGMLNALFAPDRIEDAARAKAADWTTGVNQKGSSDWMVAEILAGDDVAPEYQQWLMELGDDEALRVWAAQVLTVLLGDLQEWNVDGEAFLRLLRQWAVVLLYITVAPRLDDRANPPASASALYALLWAGTVWRDFNRASGLVRTGLPESARMLLADPYYARHLSGLVNEVLVEESGGVDPQGYLDSLVAATYRLLAT